jgi:hypothetical protein
VRSPAGGRAGGEAARPAVRGAGCRGCRRQARALARVPHGQRRGADARLPARRRCVRRLVRRPDGIAHPCAINLGRRPTFYEHADHSLLEAHLIDFDGDLYWERARVQFTTSSVRAQVRRHRRARHPTQTRRRTREAAAERVTVRARGSSG